MEKMIDMIGLDGLKVGYKFIIIAEEPAMTVDVPLYAENVKLDPTKILSLIQVLEVNPDNIRIGFAYHVSVEVNGKPGGHGSQNVCAVVDKEKNRNIKISSDMVVYDTEVGDVNKSLKFAHLEENTADSIDAISQLAVSCVEDPERLTLSVTVEDSELTAYMTKDQAIVMARHILNLYKADFEEGTIRMSNKIMEGLYLIHAGISSSFSGSETYPERPIMEHAHNCIIEWGREHKIDCYGEQFRKQQYTTRIKFRDVEVLSFFMTSDTLYGINIWQKVIVGGLVMCKPKGGMDYDAVSMNPDNTVYIQSN